MMFLMAIGVSTMAAGAANSGALMRQNEYNKILMLGKSVHDNIMFSLQNDPGNEDLLGYQLARTIFEAYDTNEGDSDPDEPDVPTINDMIIRINGEELYPPNPPLDMIYISNAAFRFPLSFKESILDSPAIEFDDIFDGVDYITPPPIPRTVTINARMVVEVEITSRDLRAIGENRQIVTRATYEYRNGRLIEDPSGDMNFDPDWYGEWRLVRYEIIDPSDPIN